MLMMALLSEVQSEMMFVAHWVIRWVLMMALLSEVQSGMMLVAHWATRSVLTMAWLMDAPSEVIRGVWLEKLFAS